MSGAILVGGRSTRMGADKASLILRDGRTMLEHVATALRTICDRIVLVGEVAGQVVEYATIADSRPGAGPLGGIEALLGSGVADEYLVCPCDVPDITPHVLRELLKHRDAPATVLRMVGRPRFESLPARISIAALPRVTRLLDSNERSIWQLMEQMSAAIVEVDEHHAAALRNVNTPEDLSTA
jgi:molybdopterin-guanine dinucleotide biosynthesis protein A